MTLIITAFAAILTGILRLSGVEFARRLSLGVLALIYVGAGLMWFVDAISSALRGEGFIATDRGSVISETLLGVCVVVLGLVAWAGYLLITRLRRKTPPPQPSS